MYLVHELLAQWYVYLLPILIPLPRCLPASGSLRFRFGDHGLLAHNNVIDGGELLVETGGAKDERIFTRLAGVRVLIFLVVILVDGEDNVLGSDEVDILVVAAGTEVEAGCCLGPGPLISGNWDTDDRVVWVASGESRVAQRNRIK